MRISLNWLKEYVNIDASPEELARQLTMLGLEIEAIERPGAEIKDIYVGRILSIDPHPDADKLVVCKTDTGGDEPLQIVCGATNMQAGDYVPTAVIGAELPGGFKIARRKMRGIESQGMMCSARELGLGEDHSGLLILDGEPAIGADAKALLGLDDVVFEIEVIPNRGDWASMIGVARELAALYGTALRIPELSLEESGEAASALSSVTIEDADLCPRYIGRVLTDVHAGPSPQWLCSRLIAAGQRPINNIVDITNYVLLETGHPLHAFDYDRLAENRVVVRRAKAGEKITTLDDEERRLDAEMLVIAGASAPQAVAGVMGGADSEVSESTTRIFLESAYFKPASVRRTSRELGLISEASQHFQRGADPEMAVYAINRCAQLMQELAGAKVAPGLIDEYPAPLDSGEVTLRYTRANRLLGTDIPAARQKDILEKLAFEVVRDDAESCTVRVPAWRHDVTFEADLIEEVARFHGYDNVPVTLPSVRPSDRVYAPAHARQRELRRFLAGQGLTELYNWTFSSPEALRRAGLAPEAEKLVMLENPLSENHAAMRAALAPALLANAAHNINHGVRDIAAFELGPVFRAREDRELPEEELRLGVVLSGQREPRHWSRKAASSDFYDLKGLAEALFEEAGIEAAFEAEDCAMYQPGQAARIVHDKKPMGSLGKISREVMRNYAIEEAVYLMELRLPPVLEALKEPARFEAVPEFPPSMRDMAVIVDRDVPAGALLETAARYGGKLLKSVEIFDIYTGDPVPEGRQSVAINLIFQSGERTLTDKDTQKAWDKVLKRLQSEYRAELR
jgi:phenylalanyl-tRNA synthetase beta chain